MHRKEIEENPRDYFPSQIFIFIENEVVEENDKKTGSKATDTWIIISVDDLMRFWNNATTPMGTREQISKKDLDHFAAKFRKCAGEAEKLDKEGFAKIISSKNVKEC